MTDRETRIIHAGSDVPSNVAPVTTPIFATTTFSFADAASLEAFQRGESGQYIYSRYANPTVQATEAMIAEAEGAEAAMVVGSGMAATSTALLGLLSAGDEVVYGASLYGGTLQLLTNFLHRFGITTRTVPMASLTDPALVCGPKTRVVWFESPTNPTLRCVDIAGVAAACRAHGVISIIDNTFASPINQQPLAMGVDLAMHSATKYLNGHSDVTAGVVTGSRALIERLAPARKLLGGILEPASAYALGRGMKTLGVRMARHNASAFAVAEWLERQPAVSRVYYPGLASHPDHAIARAQMRGYGGMVCFEHVDGYAGAVRTFNAVRLFLRAASLGGVESLCTIPVLTSQYGLNDAQLAEAGVTPGMLRLSIGLESPDDLIADLAQALNTR
jgi:cystathionine beta-lyase/cystathionine gamma-synthase